MKRSLVIDQTRAPQRASLRPSNCENDLVSKIVLEGGSDVAEMVLFSIDEIPPARVSEKTLAGLEANNQAIRMPTGGDGGYLLHLYVDEQVPDEVMQYCIEDDALTAEFRANSGQIAFGGAESTFAEFNPNDNIRTDTRIAPGVYDAVAFHTDHPDDLVEDAVEKVIGPDGKRAEDVSTYIIIGTVVLAFAFYILGSAIAQTRAVGLVLAAIVVIAGRLWYKSHARSEHYRKADALRREVHLEYPSIVIRLTKRGA